jgi:hypothetical protein
MATTISDRRQALAELARSRRADGSAGRNLRIAAVIVAALGLMGLLGRWLSGRWSTPPELLAVRASVDGQIAEVMEDARSGAAYAPDAGSAGTVFAMIRQLPEAYREQARAEIGRLFEAREAAEVESYFALPPDQRAAELDRRIKAEEQRRQAREAERNQRLAEAGGRAGGPPQAGASGPPSGGRRRDGSEEGRNARSKRQIDKTSAESRARRTEYRRAKDQRRIQLGLAPRRW